MESEISYEEKIKAYTLNELYDVKGHIDKEKYPDRYQAILNAISEKKKLQSLTQNEITPPENARNIRTITRIQNVYLGFLLYTVIWIIAGIIRKIPLQGIIESLLVAACAIAIYFGLRRKMIWVIPLILIGAATTLLTLLIDILHPAENSAAIFDKILSGLLLVFYAYQLFFFRKPAVREFMGDRGKTLFH